MRKSQGSASTLRRDDRPHRQQWYAGVLEHDHAYQWSRHVHPVYGINLIGLRAGLRYLVGPGKLNTSWPVLWCRSAQPRASWGRCWWAWGRDTCKLDDLGVDLLPCVCRGGIARGPLSTGAGRNPVLHHT